MNIPQAVSRVQQMPGLDVSVRSMQVQPWFAFSKADGCQIRNGAIPEIWRSIAGAPAAGAFDLAASTLVRVGGLWLFQETVRQLTSAPWTRSPLEIARSAVEHGLSRMAELPQGLLTQHALMVAWGEFADETGLTDPASEQHHLPRVVLFDEFDDFGLGRLDDVAATHDELELIASEVHGILHAQPAGDERLEVADEGAVAVEDAAALGPAEPLVAIRG